MNEFLGFFTFAQVLGLVASIFTVGAFFFKREKKIKIALILGNILFCSHFFMLGAYTAAGAYIISATRTGLSFKFDKSYKMMALFLSIYIINGIITYQYFYDAFAVIGSCLTTISLYCFKGVKFRLSFIIAAVFWLLYAISYLSIGGIITESFVFVVNLMMMISLLREGKNETSN